MSDDDTDLPAGARRLISTLMTLRDSAKQRGDHKQEQEYTEQIRSVRESSE